MLDEKSELRLGRPDLVFFRCRATGSAVGFNIGWEEPSYASFIAGLRHAMYPKDLTDFPAVTSPWPCYGRIENLHVDNAFQFVGNDIAKAAKELKINKPRFRPKSPWLKGALERFFGSLNTGLIHHISGTTHSKTGATEVVRRVLANKIAVLGRLGDKFGDVVVALPEPQAAAGNDRFACARETQKQAPGIGRMDASIIFGSRYEVILALIRAGWLKTVDPRSPRSRIDSDEFEAFCRRYAPTRIYISVVGCTARLVGAMLSRRGVKTIKLTVGRYQVHVVDRKSARKALDLERDPDVVDEAGAEAFTSALGEECRIRTAFKLQSRTNGLTFKTSNGLALKLLINLDGRSVRIGPHYRTRPAIERMEARKSQIVSAYPGPLTWLKREGVLMIEDHLDAPELTDRGQWPVLIERIVSKMEAFKSTFEPSQRVQRMSTRSSSARSRRREDP